MSQLSPGVFVEEQAPSIVSLPLLPTAITAFVGLSERGPVGDPVTLTSFDDYVNVFGGFTPDSDMALAAQGFFGNGGTQLIVVRTVHHTDIADPATKTSALGTLTLNTATSAPSSAVVTGVGPETYNLEPGQQLDVDVDGVGSAAAVFSATRATEQTPAAEPYALADGQTLIFEIDDDGNLQTVTFNAADFANIAAATALEIVTIINEVIVGGSAEIVDIGGNDGVLIASDTRGTDSAVRIDGGTANAVLNFPTVQVDGTGNVANIDAVTDAEAEAIIEAAITGSGGVSYAVDGGGNPQIFSNTTGPTSTIQVLGSSTATAFGFDNVTHIGNSGAPEPTLRIDGKTDGAYANLLSIEIDPATSGDADAFNLVVVRDGVEIEVFSNVTMDDSSPQFVETVVAASSSLIDAVDLDSTASDPRPAQGAFGPLSGGDDGLALLDDNDFLGSQAGGTGLHALDTEQNVSLIALPGRTSAASHLGLINYIEVFRDGLSFAVLDPPPGLTAQQMVAFVEGNGLLELSTRAAIYWPQIKILNPSKTVFGDSDDLVVPPAGHICGVYARNDRNASVWEAPAGTTRGTIAGMIGFETDDVKKKGVRDLIYPKRINPIAVFPGTPRHIDGNRTLKLQANFPTVGQVRGVIFVSQTLSVGLQFVKHESNDAELQGRVDRVVRAFLVGQMRQGAFASTNPETAFFVKTGEDVNTPSVIAEGKFIVDIGLATARPVDFVIVRISQDTSALEQELAGA